MKYNLLRPWETLDPWQDEYINTDGDCLVVAGRQVGKTAAAAIKINRYLSEPNKTIMIGALTEKQAFNLYQRALLFAEELHKVEKGEKRPTRHKFEVKHKKGNSIVMCHALGLTGEGIRGFTVDHLFIDECKEIAEEVFTAIEPMISVTKGTRDYLGTPAGKKGHFWKCSNDPRFKKFEVSAYDCPRHDKKDLERYKQSMSAKEFAQEYLGQFLDDVIRFFSDKLINNQVVLEQPTFAKQDFSHYGGADIARLGDNKSAFSIGKSINENYAEQVYFETSERQLTTETSNKILELQKKFNCKKWGIDGGGVGGGVIDQCRLMPELKWKVEDLNNAKKTTDADRLKGTRLMKEHMYINLLRMLENNQLKLIKNDEIIESLVNTYYEYDDRGRMRIFGPKNDPREAIIRMAWMIANNKSLNLWADYT